MLAGPTNRHGTVIAELGAFPSPALRFLITPDHLMSVSQGWVHVLWLALEWSPEGHCHRNRIPEVREGSVRTLEAGVDTLHGFDPGIVSGDTGLRRFGGQHGLESAGKKRAEK